MSPVAVVASFRLGGTDGVSVEARKWAWALGELGFDVRRLAGEFADEGEPDDVLLPGLGITPSGDAVAEPARLLRALDGADLVVVENLCSLPLNPAASRAMAVAAAEHASRTLFRHHDLPWQRRHLGAYSDEFPPRQPGALHTTVNLRSRRELEARRYSGAVTIHNYFDLDAVPADRAKARAALGFADGEFVVFQPGRAIERKNVPGGVRYAGRLQQLLDSRRVVYWLAGPAEDSYGPTLDKVLARATVPVRVGLAPSIAEGYAAADVVVFPSTWEGFGNPTVEAIAARRPIAVFSYPVLGEIAACGLRFFSTDLPEAMVEFLHQPDDVRSRYHDVNLHRARLSFSLADLPAAIEDAFRSHGWSSW